MSIIIACVYLKISQNVDKICCPHEKIARGPSRNIIFLIPFPLHVAIRNTKSFRLFTFTFHVSKQIFFAA